MTVKTADEEINDFTFMFVTPFKKHFDAATCAGAVPKLLVDSELLWHQFGQLLGSHGHHVKNAIVLC